MSRFLYPLMDIQADIMDHYFMEEALALAHKAYEEGEIPVGALVVAKDRIIGRGYNQTERLNDVTAHAEMIAITQAAQALDDWRLAGCTLYVTLEPCIMCCGAILQARIPTVVYGATDPKAGAVQTLFHLLSDNRLNHRCQMVPGVLAQPCGEILSRFFQDQRRLGKK